MNSILSKSLLFALVWLWPPYLGAATIPKFAFIGFSKDGTHLAFEAYGISDGSGFAFSTITLVNVGRNEWAGPPISTTDRDETGKVDRAREQNRRKADSRLLKLGIVDGNRGSHVIADVAALDYLGPFRFSKPGKSESQEEDYQLLLTETAYKKADCAAYTPPQTKIFELALQNGDGQVKTLQKDAAIPKSRGCPQEYNLSDVYLYQDSIAVFIKVFSPGFEGADMNYLVVTGKLN